MFKEQLHKLTKSHE